MNTVASNPILILHAVLIQSIHTGIIDLHPNLAPANNFTGNNLYYCPI